MIGDRTDFHKRIKAVLPPWFPSSAPVLDTVLYGFAAAFTLVYDFLTYTKRQTRIATAESFWLDLAAYDFFGMRFRRRVKQSDDSFRVEIIKEVLRERVTRRGMVNALRDLTGVSPIIFEPRNIRDTGAYGVASGLAYNVRGGYGSHLMPAQVLIKAQRPIGSGIPNVNGYGGEIGGFGEGQIVFAQLSDIKGFVTDADIYRMVLAIKAAGVTTWVAIVSDIDDAPPFPGYLLAPSGDRLVTADGSGILLLQ